MLLSVVKEPLQNPSTRYNSTPFCMPYIGDICELNNSIIIVKTIEGVKKILRMQKVPTENFRGSFYILKRNLNLQCENMQTYTNHLYEEVCENCKNSHSLKIRLRMQKVPLRISRGSFYILKRNLNLQSCNIANLWKLPLRGIFHNLRISQQCKFKKILRMQKVPSCFLRGTFYILKRNLNLHFTQYKNYAKHLYEEVCENCKNLYVFKKILRMQKVPSCFLRGSFYILKRNLKNYANHLYEEVRKSLKGFKFRLRMQKEPLRIERGSFYILKITLNENIAKLTNPWKLPLRGKFHNLFISQDCKFKETLRMQKEPLQILRGSFYILKRNLNLQS